MYLPLAQAALEKTEAIASEREAALKRKENDVHKLMLELSDEREAVSNVGKKVKQLQYHLTEAEEQIAEQKSLRARAEKHSEELTHEIKELLVEVDETAAAELKSAELRKKAEQELNNLRREVAENNKRNDLAFAQLKKKHDDALNEMSRQVESLIKHKSK